MLQIVLIRPGCTEYDLQGRVLGTLDVPLCDEGRKQAQAAIEPLRKLGIETLYCTACTNAAETGELLAAALDVKLKKLDKLVNLDQGLWQGMVKDDIRIKQPKVYRQWQDNPESICPPQGEMLSELIERVDQSLKKLTRKHKEGVIGLIAPDPLASVLAAQLNACELGDLWKGGECGTFEAITVGAPASAASAEAQ